MVSIDAELEAIKRDPRELLDEKRVLHLCHEAGYRPEADGPLDPATLVALFMRQIAEGNVSCEAVRMMGGDAFSASAYCQARMRLPLEVIQGLARDCYREMSDRVDRDPEHRYRGHRVLLMDATGFSMPDTPELQRHFGQSGQQKPGCGFPGAHMLMLFNARTGLAVDALTAPLRTHEMSLAAGTHGRMSEGDLVVGDDSFGSYAHFALLLQRGMHGLFPAHHMRLVDFTPHRPHAGPGNAGEGKGLPRSRWIKSLGKDDQLVEWFKPTQKPKWMSAADWKKLPGSIILREVRRTVPRKGFRPVTLTIVTTLVDPTQYPPDELFELRVRRWDVESDLRHLKTTMKMEVLHSQTVEGVHKELWMFLLIYNLVRMVMLSAAKRQRVPVSRVSFACALHWMRYATEGQSLPRLALAPHRPDRIEPRAIKRRPKQYDLLVRPRAQMREEARNPTSAKSRK